VSVLERVQAALASIPHALPPTRDGMVCIEVDAARVHDVCALLRDACGFETNTFVTAIDHFPREPRFEVLWQFLSLARGDRVRVRARVNGSSPRVPTIIDLWPGAAFSERECYDMFGIQFDGHPDLKRLLMPDGYDHFPLRKDFPHQGIEPDRLYREWDERRHERHEHAAGS
jgi:NADH-quinone oxidoreductase subunit C